MPFKNNAQLTEQWLILRTYWFPERIDLDTYQISWSTRPQKHTLASCQIKTRCVFVASELNWPTHWLWLEPLLYHELCHAALGLEIEINMRGRRAWHGASFKKLETRHPLIPLLNDWVERGGWHQAVRNARRRKKISSLV